MTLRCGMGFCSRFDSSKGVSWTGVHKRWVWHHNEILGIKELTDREEHTQFTHTGGVSFYEILTRSKYR